MAHISRKELKKDEVRETFAHGAEALLSHQRLTTYTLSFVLVAAVGFFGWKTYTERQTVRASAAFDDAMKDFQAPVIAPGETPQPGGLTYVDEKMKFGDASRKFGDVAARYGRTQPGQLAKYYQALSLERLGKNEDAKQLLQELAGSSEEEFAAMAKLELASLEDRMGQPDEAVKLYQQLLAKPTVLVPKPVTSAGARRTLQPEEPCRGREILRADQVRISPARPSPSRPNRSSRFFPASPEREAWWPMSGLRPTPWTCGARAGGVIPSRSIPTATTMRATAIA